MIDVSSQEVVHEGGFQVTGEWVTVAAEDVLTAREVFNRLQEEGFRCDYLRVPVTCVVFLSTYNSDFGQGRASTSARRSVRHRGSRTGGAQAEERGGEPHRGRFRVQLVRFVCL
jgi:hypothetical protein